MKMDAAVGHFIHPTKQLFYKQLASNQVTSSINSHTHKIEPPQVNDEAKVYTGTDAIVDVLLRKHHTTPFS